MGQTLFFVFQVSRDSILAFSLRILCVPVQLVRETTSQVADTLVWRQAEYNGKTPQGRPLVGQNTCERKTR